MLTDRLPRNRALVEEFEASDRLLTLELPADDRLRAQAISIEAAMKAESATRAQGGLRRFSASGGRLLLGSEAGNPRAGRAPDSSGEGRWARELFGDYAPATGLIRNWMRTAVRKEVTSFGTFLSTLCHEFCHHLDFHKYTFTSSYHTRGFYERAAVLYHHARGTSPKRLYWIQLRGQRWHIDWPRTNRGSRKPERPFIDWPESETLLIPR